jgi:hypothetical protein
MPIQGNDEWISLAREMSDLYKFTEYETVKEEKRRVATVFISDENYRETIDRINKDGLYFTPIRKTPFTEDFFSGEKDSLFWYGSLSKNYKDGEEFRIEEEKQNHSKIGKMLGYPSCCVSYFNKNIKSNFDPIWIDMKGNIKGHPECNNLLHYFKIQITPHFSCSPNCKNTKKIGEEWFSTMVKKNRKIAEKVYKLLEGEIVWDSYHGVAHIETPYFVGLSNTFPFLEKKKIINWKTT